MMDNHPMTTEEATAILRHTMRLVRWIWAAVVATLVMVAYDTDAVYRTAQFLHTL